MIHVNVVMGFPSGPVRDRALQILRRSVDDLHRQVGFVRPLAKPKKSRR